MKNEEKTTTYTASDLPEEIHSDEPVKDAEIVKNAETESETTESEIVESGSTESETTESSEDSEVKTSESAIETNEAEEPDENKTTIETATETTTEATKDEDSEESEKGGFTRGKLIKIFAMEVLAFVIFIFAIIAWFSMNEDVSATGMQIKVQTPGGIYVSLGVTQNHYSNPTSDSLVLQSGTVVDPTSSDVDWTSELTIDSYYCFGKMIPASSTTGEHIYFTPDAALTGRELKDDPRYFQADTHTDGYLKQYVGSGTLAEPAQGSEYYDSDSLAATSHPYGSGAEKNGTWNTYRRNNVWNDTNDDGYYVFNVTVLIGLLCFRRSSRLLLML